MRTDDPPRVLDYANHLQKRRYSWITLTFFAGIIAAISPFVIGLLGHLFRFSFPERGAVLFLAIPGGSLVACFFGATALDTHFSARPFVYKGRWMALASFLASSLFLIMMCPLCAGAGRFIS